MADGIEDVESLVEEATRLECEVMNQNLLNDQRLTKLSAELVDVAHELSVLYGFTGSRDSGLLLLSSSIASSYFNRQWHYDRRGQDVRRLRGTIAAIEPAGEGGERDRADATRP